MYLSVGGYPEHNQTNQENKVYYIVEKIDNLSEKETEITITKKQPTGNRDGKPITHGWCGSYNDVSTHAYGAYDTEAKARAAISEFFGECREQDIAEEDREEGEVAAFHPGQYEPLREAAVGDFIYNSVLEDVEFDTTDDQLAGLSERYEKEANLAGFTLEGRQDKIMGEYRQELICEMESAL